MLTVTEAGLYHLVIRSNSPLAVEFTSWVCGDVLPSIRKHDAYMTPEKVREVLRDPDTVIQLATELKEEQEKRQKLEEENAEMKPHADYAGGQQVRWAVTRESLDEFEREYGDRETADGRTDRVSVLWSR